MLLRKTVHSLLPAIPANSRNTMLRPQRRPALLQPPRAAQAQENRVRLRVDVGGEERDKDVVVDAIGVLFEPVDEPFLPGGGGC